MYVTFFRSPPSKVVGIAWMFSTVIALLPCALTLSQPGSADITLRHCDLFIWIWSNHLHLKSNISKVVLEFRPIADIALASKNALAPQQRHKQGVFSTRGSQGKPSNVAVLFYNILKMVSCFCLKTCNYSSCGKVYHLSPTSRLASWWYLRHFAGHSGGKLCIC